MFHSIRIRLAATFFCFFLILESVQLGAMYLFMNHAFRSQKENTMLQAFDEINDDLDDKTTWQDTLAVISDYEVTSNLYFCMIDRENDSVFYSTNESIQDSVAFTHVDDSKYEEEADPAKVEGYNSNSWLALYRTIETDQHLYNTVIWTCYEAEFNQTMLGLFPIILLTILGSCLLSAILAIPFSSRIVYPIRQIDQAAQRITRQDFSTNLPLPKQKDELYRLSNNINHMSSRLKEDMDTLKNVNAQLEQDIKEKQRQDMLRREFLSNVSHELKTPLAIVTSYAEMLKYEGEHIDTEEYLDVILEESKLMNSMIGRLLEVSRLEHGAAHMTLSECNFSDLCESLAETQKLLFDQQQLTCKTEFEKDLFVMADETYLSQAIRNYIGNALKYSDPNGTVTMCLKKDDKGNARFSISNPCTPLDEDSLSSIWESFYKLDKSRNKDRNMSVGLGLYIVKTIITGLHGTCDVTNLEHGICFSLSLPLLEKEMLSHEVITS